MAVSVRDGSIFIVSPTESVMTTRGTRHPDLARYLVQRGRKVVYVSTTFSHAEKRVFPATEIAAKCTGMPYELILLDVGRYERNVSFARVRWHRRLSSECFRLLRQRLSSADVLVIPSRPPELISVAARLQKIAGCAVVVDIRDVWPDALPGDGSFVKRFFAVYCDHYLRRALPELAHFVHTAPSFVKWLHRYAPDHNSTFIPLGFDPERWGDVGPQCLTQSQFLSLVYVGLLQSQVNIMPIVSAIHSRADVHLTIIGDSGKGERYGEVSKYVTENRMTNIHMVGQVPPSEVPNCLTSQHVGIVPMIMPFAMPNKVFDYLGARLPILSLGENDCSEFVRRQDIGWALPYDTKAVAGWLDSLKAEDVSKKSKNVALVRDQYSRTNLFARYAAVIDRARAAVNT